MTTPDEMREIAKVWDESAVYCRQHGQAELAARDERIASALRESANIIEAKTK